MNWTSYNIDMLYEWIENGQISSVSEEFAKYVNMLSKIFNMKQRFDIYGDKDADILIVTYGRIFSEACKAREQLLKLGKKVCILKLNIIKPIDKKAINFALGFKNIFFFEEGMLSGGIGETFGYQLGIKDYKDKYRITAIKDKFVPQSKVQSALRSLGLDAKGIEKVIMSDS